MNFSSYFKKKVSFKIIDKGLTNQNFLTNNGYIIKVYSNLVPNNEVAHQPLVKDLDTPLHTLNEKVKISEYIKDSETLDSGLNKDKINKAINLIKKLHSKKIKVKLEFRPKTRFNNYLSQIKKPLYNYQKWQDFVDKAEKLFNEAKLILCHNDLTFANFLMSSNKQYLIDWEYSGMNDPLFDVVCFLTINNHYFTKYRDVYLKAFFKEKKIPWLKIRIWANFQHLLWTIWANMMYDKTNKNIYKEITKIMKKNLDIKNHRK